MSSDLYKFMQFMKFNRGSVFIPKGPVHISSSITPHPPRQLSQHGNRNWFYYLISRPKKTSGHESKMVVQLGGPKACYLFTQWFAMGAICAVRNRIS